MPTTSQPPAMNAEAGDSQITSDKAILSSGLLGVSREYALEQHLKYRQQLEDCDHATLEALAMLLIQKRSVDGMNGRRWDAGAHLYFEDAVESMMRPMTPNDGTEARRRTPLPPVA